MLVARGPRRGSRRSILAAYAVALAVAWPRDGRAEPDDPSPNPPVEDPPPAPTAPTAAAPTTAPPAPTAPDPPAAPPPRFPQHFVFGNGLALLLTRLSIGYELLPVAHHSIGLSIHGQYGGGIASELVGLNGSFVGLGGELGYRFYAWRDGPFGPFVGVSFLMGYYHTQGTFYRIDPNAFRYLQFGPAVDFGWSVHLDRTTVLAVGLGAQYTFVDVDPRSLQDLPRLLVGDGPRPRGQIQVGKTF
jgi:hypothetical protein